MSPPTDDQRWMRPRRRLQSAAEWEVWDWRHPMTQLLEGRVSDRKARLFECACLRRLQHWPTDGDHRRMIDVIERQADGLAALDEVHAAALARREIRSFVTHVMGGMWNQAFDDWEDHHSDAWQTALQTCEVMNVAAGSLIRAAAGLEEGRPEEEHRAPEERAQCDLLRCIFSNPFSPPAAIAPRWLDWNDGTVRRLALATYEHRDETTGLLPSARLAVLADALEEAGCTAQDVMLHLRSRGHHVRGCWVLDALLDRA